MCKKFIVNIEYKSIWMCVCVYTVEIYLPYPTMCLANKKNASIVYDHDNHKEKQCLNLIS